VTTISERYVLEREIGRGASGSVWVASDKQLRRQVAIKLLRADSLSPAWLARFEREARTVAQLRGPHVVQVFDTGLNAGVPFIVMELLEGESLEQRLDRMHRFSLRHAAAILSDIAKGLSMTHLAGVVHCDLKPANIFLAREGGREVAKLLDFGIARTVDPQPQDEGRAAAGTPSYMSPEQFDGSGSNAADDLWAMAVTGYQMVTGELPFRADSVWQLRQQIAAGAFHPACARRSELPAELDSLFARLFSRDPAQRIGSASQLASEFLRLAQNQDGDNTRILFLDDEADMELLVRTRFQREVTAQRYELIFGRDGREGLEALHQRPDIDVVLTDINMPGMDGLTFLAKAAEINPFVRVVVVTAYNDMDNIRTAMNHGAFDFLCKPIDFADLKRTIQKSAEHVHTLRHAFASGRQNAVMKLMTDPVVADRLLRALEIANAPEAETLVGTVAWLQVRGLHALVADGNAAAGLDYLNQLYDVAVPPILALEGRVIRLADDALVAVFSGADHVRRAAEVCLTIRDELQTRLGTSSNPGGGLVMGLDTGAVVIGTVGSMTLGRIGQAVVGAAVLGSSNLVQTAPARSILASRAVQGQLDDAYVFEACQASEVDAVAYRLERRTSGVLRVAARDTVEQPALLGTRHPV
jgi:CheY-like chemotaxis protein/tRNA A-37 threonylcarbamoyl transferase component Bud32/class 3 adenylate cyclase